MKTIKIAIWINIILYVSLLCIYALGISKVRILVVLRLIEIMSMAKSLFFIFTELLLIVFFYAPPVLCIIGLLRKKNWGRILTVIVNIFLVITVAGNIVSDILVAKDISFLQVITSQQALLTYIVAIPFIALTVILLRKEAKSYFKTSTA